MASTLSVSELKKSLGSPPALDLPALTKALDKYVQLSGKGDYEDEVPALGEIGDLAISARQKVKDATKKEEKGEKKKDVLAKLSKLSDFLDDLIKEAQTAKKEAAAEAEKEEEGFNPNRGLILRQEARPRSTDVFRHRSRQVQRPGRRPENQRLLAEEGEGGTDLEQRQEGWRQDPPWPLLWRLGQDCLRPRDHARGEREAAGGPGVEPPQVNREAV